MLNQRSHRSGILVAYSDPSISLVLREVLTDAGYRCYRASNSSEALAIISNRGVHFGVLLLAEVFHYEEGHNHELIIRHARAERPYSKIIVLTGMGRAEDRRFSLQLGAHDSIYLPFVITDLLSRVEAAGNPLNWRSSRSVSRRGR